MSLKRALVCERAPLARPSLMGLRYSQELVGLNVPQVGVLCLQEPPCQYLETIPAVSWSRKF